MSDRSKYWREALNKARAEKEAAEGEKPLAPVTPITSAPSYNLGKQWHGKK